MTKRSLLKQILEQGLLPKCGPDAFANGQETECINVYTSRAAVRDALSSAGDFMTTHAGIARDELCVINIVLEEAYRQFIDYQELQMCGLRRTFKPTEFVVLDTNLRPIPCTELAALAAE